MLTWLRRIVDAFLGRTGKPPRLDTGAARRRRLGEPGRERERIGANRRRAAGDDFRAPQAAHGARRDREGQARAMASPRQSRRGEPRSAPYLSAEGGAPEDVRSSDTNCTGAADHLDLADAPPPLDGNIWDFAPIMDLKSGQCRYIAGEPSACAVYCARPARAGSPWCERHARLAHAPTGGPQEAQKQKQKQEQERAREAPT